MSEPTYSVSVIIDDPDIYDYASPGLIEDQLHRKAEEIAGRALTRHVVCGWGYSIPLAFGVTLSTEEASIFKLFVEENWGLEVKLRKDRKRRRS